ncbi:hypothetical protein [Streptomyces gardneri]|uniref:Uncharacterized protein n=1 Tax=Streptomyces gardneri TaxID=66892 RepID=A0A4Y3S030_9ACTN|nr:hypothetical protein [Streptomyces gardneri]GEB61520.1 hypothetical protein SGA01_71250 [Streptomyces gardneri]GHG82105.1 hypothetical protein GCM10017674_03470 [Streptomyces gardneri]
MPVVRGGVAGLGGAAALLRPGRHPGQVADDPLARRTGGEVEPLGQPQELGEAAVRADDPELVAEEEGRLGEGVEESGGEGQLLLGCFVHISE